MKYFKLFFLLNLLLFLISCGFVQEGFKNQKKDNSDEFLVEKKSPLVMPPDFDDLPSPKIGQKTIEKEDNEIKLLINQEDNATFNEKNNTDKNFEENLLEKIKSN